MLTPENIDQDLLHGMTSQLEFGNKDQVETKFDDPEALTPEFKATLLTVLARRKKENLRSGRILTVSHPDMEVSDQIPFMAERSEVPAITIRRCTPEDRQSMRALRDIFPSLMDAHNTLGSSLERRPEPGLYLQY